MSVKAGHDCLCRGMSGITEARVFYGKEWVCHAQWRRQEGRLTPWLGNFSHLDHINALKLAPCLPLEIQNIPLRPTLKNPDEPLGHAQMLKIFSEEFDFVYKTKLSGKIMC